jgi:hypothetical protein
MSFKVQVYLDELGPNAVRMEFYADGQDGDAPVRQEMAPHHPAATVMLEAAQIFWQRWALAGAP